MSVRALELSLTAQSTLALLLPYWPNGSVFWARPPIIQWPATTQVYLLWVETERRRHSQGSSHCPIWGDGGSWYTLKTHANCSQPINTISNSVFVFSVSFLFYALYIICLKTRTQCSILDSFPKHREIIHPWERLQSIPLQGRVVIDIIDPLLMVERY